jgi:hypothetical protein
MTTAAAFQGSPRATRRGAMRPSECQGAAPVGHVISFVRLAFLRGVVWLLCYKPVATFWTPRPRAQQQHRAQATQRWW